MSMSRTSTSRTFSDSEVLDILMSWTGLGQYTVSEGGLGRVSRDVSDTERRDI